MSAQVEKRVRFTLPEDYRGDLEDFVDEATLATPPYCGPRHHPPTPIKRRPRPKRRSAADLVAAALGGGGGSGGGGANISGDSDSSLDASGGYEEDYEQGEGGEDDDDDDDGEPPVWDPQGAGLDFGEETQTQPVGVSNDPSVQASLDFLADLRSGLLSTLHGYSDSSSIDTSGEISAQDTSGDVSCDTSTEGCGMQINVTEVTNTESEPTSNAMDQSQTETPAVEQLLKEALSELNDTIVELQDTRQKNENLNNDLTLAREELSNQATQFVTAIQGLQEQVDQKTAELTVREEDHHAFCNILTAAGVNPTTLRDDSAISLQFCNSLSSGESTTPATPASPLLARMMRELTNLDNARQSLLSKVALLESEKKTLPKDPPQNTEANSKPDIISTREQEITKQLEHEKTLSAEYKHALDEANIRLSQLETEVTKQTAACEQANVQIQHISEVAKKQETTLAELMEQCRVLQAEVTSNKTARETQDPHAVAQAVPQPHPPSPQVTAIVPQTAAALPAPPTSTTKGSSTTKVDEYYIPKDPAAEEREVKEWISNLINIDITTRDLYETMKDGITILNVIDKVKPGIVDWKKVAKPGTKALNLFQIATNVEHACDCFKRMNLLVAICGKDILDKKQNTVLGLLIYLKRSTGGRSTLTQSTDRL
ncbi:hypothetical protein Pelo_10588 [Pelomyxa schiedti]|nr:hypothetical protein Pelo_10588 [Pelomyxa schiedti]